LAIVIAISGMPLHISMIGIPMAIIEFRASQHSFIISICDCSIGVIRQTIPSLAISQLIRAIIGPRIIMGIIIGMPIIGMGIPIPPIIGMGIPIPPIIGIIPGPIIPGIPIPIIPGIPMPPIIPGIPIPIMLGFAMPCMGMPIDIGLIGIAFISFLLEAARTDTGQHWAGPIKGAMRRLRFAPATWTSVHRWRMPASDRGHPSVVTETKSVNSGE
jgi:hypothetical protein